MFVFEKWLVRFVFLDFSECLFFIRLLDFMVLVKLSVGIFIYDGDRCDDCIFGEFLYDSLRRCLRVYNFMVGYI